MEIAAAGLWMRVLGLTILVLFVVTAAFSLWSVVLRVAYERRNRLWVKLSDRWSEAVLAALADPSLLDEVHTLVADDEQLYFVNFVLEYHQRLRGDEQGVLRELALPYLDEIARRARHRRAEVRLRSVQTLGALGLPRYRDVLTTALRDPHDPVAAVAAQALARREFSDAAGMILDTMPRFERWAPLFLGSIVAELGPDAAPLIRERLSQGDTPAWLRTVYAMALTQLHDPRAADVAAAALSTAELDGRPDDVDLVMALLRLLEGVGRPEHVPFVQDCLNAGHPGVRARAVQTLGVLGSEEVEPALVEALGDHSRWVAASAARALLAAGGRRLVEKVSNAHEEYAGMLRRALREAEA